MANQKISELTAIVTVDNSLDVLPIVDISANTTKKVTPNALKTALALDNVNNTSDANKPVSIAQQDALNAKVDENAPITAGTAAKITFDAKGLVTSGDSLDETDLPTGINANKIGTGVVSSTEFGYLDGVTSAIQTQIDGKQATLVSGTNIKTINSESLLGSGDVALQPTLVSGTNIKTINSTSLLGSGDITISANPSGVSGAIQFSNGSAFASDASNLFWDDTNNRLGVGTNVPTLPVDILGGASNGGLKVRAGNTTSQNILDIANNAGTRGWVYRAGDGVLQFYGGTFQIESQSSSGDISLVSGAGSGGVGINTSLPTARLHVRGSGTTAATTSLLVQNSAGASRFSVKDDGQIDMGGANATITIYQTDGNYYNANTGHYFLQGNNFQARLSGTTNPALSIGNGATAANASSILDLTSTNRGFLPPRMTTTEKNAIASPAAGLVVYDNTTNKLCCYNGSTWNDLF
jgi:hypothetical protein